MLERNATKVSRRYFEKTNTSDDLYIYIVSLWTVRYARYLLERERRRRIYIGLTRVKDRQPGNRVFQSLVGRAPKSIRGPRPNYAATRRLVHASAICRQRWWGGRACSTLDATSNQWIQMVSTRAIRKLIRSGATSPTKLHQLPTRHHTRGGGSPVPGLNRFGARRLIQPRFNLDWRQKEKGGEKMNFVPSRNRSGNWCRTSKIIYRLCMYVV